MKQNIFILFSIVFLSGCNPLNPDTQLPYGWLPMPEEKIKSYFPIKENDTVTYISENNETLSFECCVYSYGYSPYWQKREGKNKGLHTDGCSCMVRLQRIFSSSGSLNYFLGVMDNRTRLNISYIFNDIIDGNLCGIVGIFDKEFETDHKKDKGMGYPKYPNEFIEYLTDTIELRKRDTEELTGILVSGKGLAWFTDHEGVKWYLQE